MPKIVAHFEIELTQFIDENINIVAPLPSFAKDKETMLKLYRQMQLLRLFDARAVTLQRTGKLGTFPSSLGQEAVFTAMGDALHKDDVYVPYYRDHGCLIQRGMRMEDVLSYWGGDERSNDFKTHREDFPLCVPIATQCLHSAGVAMAMQYRKQKRVVMTCGGDGCASKGDFYEALNIAGSRKLPVLFIINNNQWAISVSRQIQTSCETIAQKAIAGGFSGEQVDGNDVIAMRYAIGTAIDKMRDGFGPHLIEALSYRLADHTTADDANRYRPKEEYEVAKKKEPIGRIRQYIGQTFGWTEAEEEKLLTACKQEVEQAAQAYLTKPKAKISDIFDYHYAAWPRAYQAQRDNCLEFGPQELHHD